ncbi:MAG: hypothetical protein ACTSPP_02465 [Candidatus Heimdallarchaeaceae archaeon]
MNVSEQGSKLDIIITKLKDHLDQSFWLGKGTRNSFKKSIKNLLEEGVLTKAEYSYIQKNERRVLTKAQLIHIIPEIQQKDILENTIRNLSRVIVKKKSSSIDVSEENVKQNLQNEVRNYMKDIFEEKFETISDEFDNVISIILNSVDVSLELEKLSNRLISIRDSLLEKGYSRMLIYDIEEMPSREELADHIKQLYYSYKMSSKDRL